MQTNTSGAIHRMRRRRRRGNRSLCALWLFALFAATGCAASTGILSTEPIEEARLPSPTPEVRLTYIRPPVIDLAEYGNELSVEPLVGHGHEEAASLATALLRVRLANSRSPEVRLLAKGGPLVVRGAILRYDYHETITTTRYRRPRRVDLQRDGSATVEVEISVVRAADQEILSQRIYRQTDHVWKQLNNSQSRHAEPEPIDSNELLAGVVHSIASDVACMFLPCQKQAQEALQDCGGDERCATAADLVEKEGGLAQAVALYEAVLTESSQRIRTASRQRVADAHYNRAVLLAYQGRFGEARDDLNRALQLRPDESSHWSSLNTRIDALERGEGCELPQ